MESTPLGSVTAPMGGVDADLDDGAVTLQGGGDGNLVSQCSNLQAPLRRGGSWLPPKHTHSWTKVGYPENQYNLAVMQPLGRPRYPLNNGTMRYSAINAIAQSQ